MYSTPPRPSSSSSTSSPYLPPQHLFAIAHRKCLDRLPHVIDIINQHISTNNPDDSTFLRWDTGFIRDACYFAAHLAATDDTNILETTIDDLDFKENGLLTSLPRHSAEDSVAICMAAISRMTWAGSKTEERQQNIKMIWDSRKGRRHHQNHRSEPDLHYRHPPLFEQQSIDPVNSQSHDLQSDRPLLPPLSLCAGQRRVESAPSTSYTSDGTGANGWPCYTPPGTATSNTTSTGTGLSASGSPVFPNVGSYKNNIDDNYYHNTSSDLDQFHFNVPVYSQRSLPSEPHTISGSSSSSYLGQTFTTVSPLIVSPGEHDFDGYPQFGESCHGTYHWIRAIKLGVNGIWVHLISLIIDTILNYNYWTSMGLVILCRFDKNCLNDCFKNIRCYALRLCRLLNQYCLIPSCQKIAPLSSDWQRDHEVQSSGEFSLWSLWIINAFLMSSASVR